MLQRRLNFGLADWSLRRGRGWDLGYDLSQQSEWQDGRELGAIAVPLHLYTREERLQIRVWSLRSHGRFSRPEDIKKRAELSGDVSGFCIARRKRLGAKMYIAQISR